MLSRNQLTAVAIAALVVAAVVVAAVVLFALRIHATGRIKLVGLKAYADPEGTKEVSVIDWGLIPPGGLSQTTLYLKSVSTVPSNLTLTTEAWVPKPAASYITLTWDYDGSSLQPGEIRAVLFTLNVSPGITGITEFSFDIVITAAG